MTVYGTTSHKRFYRSFANISVRKSRACGAAARAAAARCLSCSRRSAERASTRLLVAAFIRGLSLALPCSVPTGLPHLSARSGHRLVPCFAFIRLVRYIFRTFPCFFFICPGFSRWGSAVAVSLTTVAVFCVRRSFLVALRVGCGFSAHCSFPAPSYACRPRSDGVPFFVLVRSVWPRSLCLRAGDVGTTR